MTASPSATYTTQTAGSEVISPSTFQTRTGNWYEVDRTVTPVTATVIINVQMSAIDVKAYNTGTGEDMTNERVVKDGTYISFRVDSNLYQVVNQRLSPGTDNTNIKVVVVDEEGTVYTALFNDETALTTSDLTNLAPTTSQFFLPGVPQLGATLDSNWALDRPDYKAGVYSFYAQVNLNGAKDNVGTVTGVTKSAVKTLEVGKDDVKVESNKDTVVRNNDFAVTITGRPDEYYVLWVKGTSSVTAPDTAPFIKPNQDKVFVAGTPAGDNAALYQFRAGQTVAADVSIAGGNDYYAMVKLASSGSRTVGFGTDETTKDQTYTIRADYFTGNALAVPPVSVVANNPTYDTVKVKVEAGDITVTTSGDSSYYIGQEIVISGTNTDSDYTWLYITGPNLPNKGGSIEDPRDGVNTAPAVGVWPYPDGLLDSGAVWSGENVETDDTWEYKWDTAGVNLDAGSYTIYAVTTATNQNDLGRDDATYGTVSISIKQPFVTATTSSATVAKGDDMYITGNAEGDPTQGVAIWILGKNYVSYTTETVEDNGAFSYKFSGTSDLAPGQYFVVVQHPMTNDQFDLAPQAGNPAPGQTSVVRPVLDKTLAVGGLLPPVFILEGPGSLQGSNAATALVDAMNSADIDDTYYKLTFMIQEPIIIISPIGDKYVGDTFTISGTTNLAVGDSLIVDVSSSSFRPAEKTQASGFSGKSGTVLVTAGDKDSENVWEFTVDASAFVPDEYIVKVQGIVADQTATQTFNVLKAEETPVATATPDTTPVATATAVPTAEPTPDETAAPGFGVLVALIGLGAVAALIVRKD
ncbi:hypothetical protein MKMG_01184 [Methanogenium sp. MK-MG]|nr:hypothetical protein MKMG_01184 [Methanogenium sp. MK-MG]